MEGNRIKEREHSEPRRNSVNRQTCGGEMIKMRGDSWGYGLEMNLWQLKGAAIT